MSYTKGEWIIEKNQSIEYANPDYCEHVIVCHGKVLAAVINDVVPEAKTNAIIISKAPEMLELLILCKYRFEEDGKDIYVQKIDKLIAEIEGEQTTELNMYDLEGRN